MSLPRSFGPYTLLRRLAVGGMAEIYVAKTLGLGGFEKLAALKLVHPHLSADPQFVRMLVDEAKILVLLTHANIAQVFDLGCIDGTHYIAMEYVDGVDVHGLCRAAARLGRALPLSVGCFVVAELLQGLDYAHHKRDAAGRPLGIVHRDISPQNVVVSRAGEVKLVDFGIAKTNLRQGGTEVGVIKGKYGYMSPEQAWADPTDARSDVFSAGVLLHELLTGASVYSGGSVAELIARVRRAEISPPELLRAEIPGALSQIVMKALAREPSERFQTALEMGEALRSYLRSSGQPFGGARLGRYVVELLETDLARRDDCAEADTIHGFEALTREEYRPESSVIFVPPGARSKRGGAPPSERVDSGPDREVSATSSALQVTAGARAREASAAPRRALAAVGASGAPELEGDDGSELWTDRWFARQASSLQISPEIRIQSEAQRERPLAAQPGPGATSIAPPTLSWPPFELGGSRAPATPQSLHPAALVPPRGEDPSLGPLPKGPALPRFGRGAGAGARGLPNWLLCALLLALVAAAFVIWESWPTATLLPGGG